MVALARAKAVDAGVSIDFVHGDAAEPPFEPETFDVVLARHVLWVFPDPDVVLAKWLRLLRPGGRLILIEGRWSTDVGLTAERCSSIVLRHREEVELHDLGSRDDLWGRSVSDERYVILSRA
jgi:SAM-dependent methyltransferase